MSPSQSLRQIGPREHSALDGPAVACRKRQPGRVAVHPVAQKYVNISVRRSRVRTRSSHADALVSELIAQACLNLSCVAESTAHSAVEVEQQAVEGGVIEVVASEDVEDLDDRVDTLPRTDHECSRNPQIPAGLGVIATERIAIQDGAVRTDAIAVPTACPGTEIVRAALLRDRLRRGVREAIAEGKLSRQRVQQKCVEAMALITIAVSPLAIESVGLGIAERERIALVVVIRLVEGESVIHFELTVRCIASCEAERDTVVLAACGALDRGECPDAVPAR